MTSPRSTFRTELASLRDQLIRSIREGIPSNITEGLGIYQRLLEQLLKRFDELEKVSGSRPLYQPLSFGLTSGEELGWLQSDYSDFLQQALRSSDAVVIVSVIHGLLAVSATCVRMGDAAAFDHFLRLLPSVWGDSRATLDDRGWKAVRSSLLQFLQNLTRLVAYRERTSSEGEVQSLAVVAKTFGELMKLAVDGRDAADLAVVSETCADAFGMTLSAAFRSSRDVPFGPFVATARRLVNAAIIGVDGWILFQWNRRFLSDPEVKSLRSALAPAKQSPWPALGIIDAYEWSGFFGWSMWEMTQNGTRGGFALSIGSFVERALLVTSVERQVLPALSDVRAGADSLLSIRDTKSRVELLLGRLDEIESDVRMRELDLDEGAIIALRDSLLEIGANAGESLVNELIALPISDARLRTFVTAAREVWESSAKVLDLFPSREYLGIDDEQPSSSASRWGYAGPYRAEAKEFFSDTQVEADPAMLAYQYVRAVLQTEAVSLRSVLVEKLPRRTVQQTELAAKARKEIDVQHDRGLNPMVILFAQWSTLDQLRDAASEPIGTGIGLAGTVSGVPVFWETAVGAEMCVILDPSHMGQLWWREVVSEASDASIVESVGRLTVEIQAVTEELATRLLEQSAGPHDGPESSDEMKRQLEQKVLVKIQERIAIDILAPDDGLVLEVLRST